MKNPGKHHLAQVNIARLLEPLDHPKIAEFTNNLDYVNALAEKSEGFVWRLKDESGNATDLSFYDDPMIIINMSVWESVDLLKQFVYASEHKNFLRKKSEWFRKIKGMHMALWWVPVGHEPDVFEAKARLQYLEKHGETSFAFTFRTIHQNPESSEG